MFNNIQRFNTVRFNPRTSKGVGGQMDPNRFFRSKLQLSVPASVSFIVYVQLIM